MKNLLRNLHAKLTSKQFQRKRWHLKHYPEHIVVIIIMLIATAARFFDITKASIWHDEGFTMMLAGRTPAEIWAGSARDVHPPLYYELLHFWTNLFGRSVFAARSLSAVAGLITIYLGYRLVKHLVNRGAATVTLLILAVAPFLVRYSQEARMYGLLGLWLIAATYALVLAEQHRHQAKYWILYAILMAAGLYTHYFTVLALAGHWAYLMTREPPHRWQLKKSLWLSREWWLANISVVVLWLPWLPSFYAQVSRGQGIGWIPKTTLMTVSGNIWQDLTFTDGGQLPFLLYWGVPFLLIAGICYAVWQLRRKIPQMELVFFYTVVPIIATVLVSTIKPIYQDRYLVFAANGLFILLGLTIYQMIRLNRVAGTSALVVLFGICCIGLINVNRQASHTMATVGQYVNEHYRAGDGIVSEELYTYFDFSYYCSSCYDARNAQVSGHKAIVPASADPVTILRLNTSGGRPNGYGESALLQDRAEAIYLDDLNTIKPASGRVWLVGKPGKQAYWDNVPVTWRPTLQELTTNSSEVRQYIVQ